MSRDSNIKNSKDKSRKELEDELFELRRDLNRCNEIINASDLRHSSVVSYWNNTIRQLGQIETSFRYLQNKLEESKEASSSQEIVAQMKVRQIIVKQLEAMNRVKTEMFNQKSTLEESLQANAAQSKRDNVFLKGALREIDYENVEKLKKLKLQTVENLAGLQKDFVEKLAMSEMKYKQQMQILHSDCQAIANNTSTEVEKRKNVQINDLNKSHQKASLSMKSYYNDIAVNSINIIKNLKEKIESSKQQTTMIINNEDNLQKKLQTQQNLISQMQNDLNKLYKANEMYKAECVAHETTKKQSMKMQKDHTLLKSAYETACSRIEFFEECQKEYDKKLRHATLRIQERLNLRNLILENKVEHLEQELEVRQTQMMVLSAALKTNSKDTNSLIKKHIENLIRSKNKNIKDMHYELTCKSKYLGDLDPLFQPKLDATKAIKSAKTSINQLVGAESLNLSETSNL